MFKFAHTIGGSAPTSTSAYIHFSELTSLYVKKADGTVLGVNGTPTLAYLSSLMVSSGEVAFSYNGTVYSITTSTLIQESSIDLDVSTATKGIQTADINPVNENSGIGANGVPFFAGHFQYIYGTWGGESSSSLAKKNVKGDFERSGLDIVNSTNIVRFTYKDEPSQRPMIGFIADYTDEDIAGQNHDSMEYTNCIGVLMKAVQELSAQNKAMQKQIDSLLGIEEQTDTSTE